jgi:hypothetical protein
MRKLISASFQSNSHPKLDIERFWFSNPQLYISGPNLVSFVTKTLTCTKEETLDYIKTEIKFKGKDFGQFILSYKFPMKLQITIVGGGMSACRLAIELYKSGIYEVTIISNTGVFEYIPSFPFLFGNPKHLMNIQREYDEIFKGRINIIKGTVKELNHNRILL